MRGDELLTGHHSDLAFDIAKEIVDSLVKGKHVDGKEALYVRGVIQIRLEAKR